MINSPWLCCKFYHPPGLIYRLKRVSFDGDGHRCSDPISAFVRRYDFGFGEVAVMPGYGYFKFASGVASSHAARLPGDREGRQQVQAVRVALEQHFCHTGRGTEVAVDLERRVGVEQVGVGAPPSVYCVSAPPTSFICRWIMRCAWSPSCARARTLIFQPMDQPVPYGTPRLL